jgi:hypothetical protein
LNSAKGRQNFKVFWGQHWVFSKGSMGADLGTVLGLKGDAFGVFFFFAELGQIRGLFWGSKGVAFEVFF